MTLSGNSLRQTVHTHRAYVHQAAKLVAALLIVYGLPLLFFCINLLSLLQLPCAFLQITYMPLCTGLAKNGLFLRVYNFATVTGRKVCDRSKVS